MYWDVFYDVLRCITILFMLTKYISIHLGIQHNTSFNTSQYLYDVLGCIATEVWCTNSNTSIIHERYLVITAIIHPWYIPDTLANTYSIHHVRDFSAATSQDRALNPGLNPGHNKLIHQIFLSVHNQYVQNTLSIHLAYIWNTWQIQQSCTQLVLCTVFSALFGPSEQPSGSGLEHGV